MPEHEPHQAGAVADRAVGDDASVRLDPVGVTDRLDLTGIFQPAVRVEQEVERKVHCARNVPAASGVLGRTRRPEAVAVELSP